MPSGGSSWCAGDNPLTLRLVDELATRYGAEVAVIRRRHRPQRAARPAPVRRPRRRLRVFALLIERRPRLILAILAALIVLGTGVLMWAKHIGWWRAAYLTVLSTFGAASAEPDASVAVQVVGVALTVVSIALIPD